MIHDQAASPFESEFRGRILTLMQELDPLLDDIRGRIEQEKWIGELNHQRRNEKEIGEDYAAKTQASTDRLIKYVNRVRDALIAAPIEPHQIVQLRGEIEKLRIFHPLLLGLQWQRAEHDLRVLEQRFQQLLVHLPESIKSDAIPQPERKKRGRPSKFPDELKAEALAAKQAHASNRECAKILYKKPYPSSQEVRNVPAILRYHVTLRSEKG